MAFLPLVLGVKRLSDGNAQSQSGIKKQTDKILKRDDFTCRFCGFHSEKYQRVIQNPDEKNSQPYVTACTFCEQCVTLERASITGPGVLIWLPEIGQAELNHIVRAIYVARAEKNELSDSATRALDSLMARRSEAKKRLGSDDPLLLATVMQEMLTADEAKKASPKLDGIRLLPSDKHLMRTPSGDMNQFPELVKYWRSAQGPFGKMPAEKWVEMFKTASSKVGHA